MNNRKAGIQIFKNFNVKKFFHWKNFPATMTLLLALLFVAVSLVIGFTEKPVLYPVDYGQYEHLLDEIGLTWKEEDAEQKDWLYTRPLTEFAYSHYSWSKLLTPGAGRSIVYLVSIVRLFTEPFGRLFSVDLMALVSAVLLFISILFLSLGLRRSLPRVWYIPVIFFGILFSNGNFCAMFRGLYPEGPMILFSLLFVGAYTYVWSIPREKRGWAVLFPVLASFLMLKAAAPMVVFLPFVAVADLVLIFKSSRKTGSQYLITAISVLFLLTGCVSTVRLAKSDRDYFSEASYYESAFNTMLPAADNAEILLLEFGLDKSYLSDIGKSYYADAESFAHYPRDPNTAKQLFEKVNENSLFQIYLLHPNLLLRVLQNVPINSQRFFENVRYRLRDQSDDEYLISRTGGGAFSFIWGFLPHSFRAFLLYALIQSLMCVAAFSLKKVRLSLLKIIYFAGSIAYLPFCVILNGYSLAPQYYLIHQFLEFTFMIDFVVSAAFLLPIVYQWISVNMDDPYRIQASAVVYPVGGIGSRVKKAFVSVVNFLCAARLRIVFITFILGVLMILRFLPDDHPVSINNGDFGRMMEQLDLMWTGDVYFDSSLQMGRSAIEEFHYLRAFDPLKLTPLKPTFTLYWFASVVRLFTEPFGRPFSTRLLAFIMSGISLICILKIIYDIFPLLKKWTLAAAFVLCMLFFSETMLTWYNSLFGESCILIGILMSMMCIVHLCLMPCGGKGCFLWLLGLAFSLYIMVGAKSQMVVTVPFAIAVFIALAVYHRPYRYDLFALYGIVTIALSVVLVYSAIGVFRSERTSESTSQKHTMWQTYFYGIFMISDDPIQDMKSLGIDTAMAPDIGKYVQFDDPSMYVYAPLSDEAQTAFYDHVSMLTVIKWYLTHPAKLWYMLDYAASQAQTLYTGFRVYNGQDYSDPAHDNVDGMNLWPGWRSSWTPGTFLGYIIIYSALLFVVIRMLLKKNLSAEIKIYTCLPLFLITAGIIQFPLSVIGNGFVDTQKQMFGFELCHDILMCGVLVLGSQYLYHFSGSIRILNILKKAVNHLRFCFYLIFPLFFLLFLSGKTVFAEQDRDYNYPRVDLISMEDEGILAQTSGLCKNRAYLMFQSSEINFIWPALVDTCDDSGLPAGKKNYSISFYTDDSYRKPLMLNVVDTWGNHNKYQLFFDSQLTDEQMRNRNKAAMDINYNSEENGFSAAVYVDYAYQGMYTWKLMMTDPRISFELETPFQGWDGVILDTGINLYEENMDYTIFLKLNTGQQEPGVMTILSNSNNDMHGLVVQSSGNGNDEYTVFYAGALTYEALYAMDTDGYAYVTIRKTGDEYTFFGKDVSDQRHFVSPVTTEIDTNLILGGRYFRTDEGELTVLDSYTGRVEKCVVYNQALDENEIAEILSGLKTQ